MITTKAVKKLVLALDGIEESPHFEKTSFRLRKKILLTLDEPNKKAVIKLDPLDQSVFCSYNNTVIFPVNGSWGKKGWTIVELASIPSAMFKDIINVAYQSLGKS